MGVAVVGVVCGDARAPWNWTRRFAIDALNILDSIVTGMSRATRRFSLVSPESIRWACSLMFAAA